MVIYITLAYRRSNVLSKSFEIFMLIDLIEVNFDPVYHYFDFLV